MLLGSSPVEDEELELVSGKPVGSNAVVVGSELMVTLVVDPPSTPPDVVALAWALSPERDAVAPSPVSIVALEVIASSPEPVNESSKQAAKLSGSSHEKDSLIAIP